jgi:putative membrane protein
MPFGLNLDIKADANTHFAWLRTRLALERTLMAAIRTGAALIGLGFAIVQFFQRFSELGTTGVAQSHVPSRALGLALIGAGILVMTISLIQYRQFMHYLWSETYRTVAATRAARRITPSVWAAVLVALIGLIVFLAIIFRAI